MFRVVATDLDGTLLRSDIQIDPLTVSTLREIEAMGVELVLATARHPLDAAHFRDILQVRAHLVSLNGARVHDPQGAPLLVENLDPAVARALMSREVAGERLLLVSSEAGWLLSRPHPRLEAYCRSAGFGAEVRDLGSHDGEGVATVMYWGEPDEIVRAEAEIAGRFAGELRTVLTTDRCFDIMAPSVSKGRALTEILRRLGVPSRDCVAFGDGQNDIDMLSAAGQPFLMSGSSPGLVAAFPGAKVAGSNDEAGVARALRGLFGLPEGPGPLNP